MDRDPSANAVDAEDRSTPTTGQSPYGESGAERARAAEDRERERPKEDKDAKVRGTRSEPGAGTTRTPLPPD